MLSYRGVGMPLLRDKRFLLTAVLCLGAGVVFWAGFDGPALAPEDTMGGLLGFESLGNGSPADPLGKRIAVEVMAWARANVRLIGFAVLFGGLVTTLLSIVGPARHRGGLGSSLAGALVGAPLGVCASCAAPLAAAMTAKGARPETALATIMSAPTLNLIAVTTLFALLPPHLALLKIGLTAMTLLVLVPLLARYAFPREIGRPAPIAVAGLAAGSTWPAAATWVLADLARNLRQGLVRSVPLVLLGGVLAATAIVLIPWEPLSGLLDAEGAAALLLMGLVALVGTLLPVPLTFDVIVCAVLLLAGLPVKYVAVLLFTLGIFNGYALAFLWKTASRRVGLVTFASVALVGVGSGVAGHYWDLGVRARERRMTLETVRERASGPEPRFPAVAPSPAAGAESVTTPVPLAAPVPVEGLRGQGVEAVVSAVPFAPRSAAGERLFTRYDGAMLGIQSPLDPHFLKHLQPFEHQGAGIASGDVDQDGYADLLIVNNGSLALYANRGGGGGGGGGGRFEALPLELAELSGVTILNGALVDLDGDGWLDLYVATFDRGAYVVRSDRGRFTAAGCRRLPTGDDRLMPAIAGFGDVDGDGRLDVVIGRWEFVGRGIRATERSTPLLLLARGDEFVPHPLPAPRGQPNAVILTDFDADGLRDVILGLDWSPSDQFLRGDGRGGFAAVRRRDGLVPVTTLSTMSLSTGDVDNDLRPEIYVGGVARYPETDPDHPRRPPQEICAELESSDRRRACEGDMRLRAVFEDALRKRAPGRCGALDSDSTRRDCVLFAALAQHGKFSAADVCDLLPPTWDQVGYLCRAFRTSSAQAVTVTYGSPRHGLADSADAIPQIDGENVLLVRGPDGRFVDRARDLGVSRAGLTWNAKFADLDNDGWVDLYVANGWYRYRKYESSYFFRNRGGEGFSEEGAGTGLRTLFPTLAYTYVDLDNDGDLDVVSVPIYGPVWVFVNNSQSGNALGFELRDRPGNVFAIGARVTVYPGDGEGPPQIRELQASGGYLSFDAPVLHFGLGQGGRVSRVVVHWPDGATSELAGRFAAGYRYRVTRADGSDAPPRRRSH
jgi:uncharacterized membrane protein YraQ (UPF0718 family)